MEVTKVSVPKNSEDGGKHPNHVNENVAVRTKNGLVNGVAGTKCKNNKKQKATNSVKKGQPNSNVDKMGESNRIEVPDEAKEKSVDCCASINSNESALNQSKTKLNDQSKSKKNKKLKNGQQDNSSSLPKLDINAGVNLDHFMSNMKMISELPSTSHLDVNKSPLLQCGSSEFEKNLIESIKSLKIQNENSECKAQSESAPEANTQANESTQLQEEELQHCDIKYVQYESELQMPMIMKIIQKDLSEPYSIYTYRYFIHNWPKLCFLAMCDEKCVGAIVCKLDYHRKSIKRGYIAMLAVDKEYRKRKIGSTLVSRAISQMVEGHADEVVLETEVTNKPALRLYEQLGFVRDKRLFRYYLNGVDALRLKLWLR